LKCFGDYELLEEIARGGMGVVYKARQVSLDRIVAVKLLLRGAYASEDFIKRFRVEASAAAALQHPNIVAIHEVGVHQGQHYFAMDLVDGLDLARLLRDGPLSATRAATYVKTIAEAIHYAHGQHILHRDLKPSNVLIDSRDHPRVTDFGLAKNLASDSKLTVTGQVCGSPSFMPPEQASGQREKVGVPSDVYSLGAILYAAVTGRPPFVGQSVGDTLKQVENAEPVAPRLLNPSVPRDLETICLKCIEKEVARRYRTAQELADDLGRFLRDEPIRARPISQIHRIHRWMRRNPAGAAFIVTLSLGLAGVLGLLQRVEAEKDEKTAAIKRMATMVSSKMEELWLRRDKDSELIRSEDLATLMGQSKKAFAPGAERLRVGLSSTEGPTIQAMKYYPMLQMIEEKLKPRLGRPVAVDLVLCKSRKARDGLVAGDIELARMGALTFLHAQALQSQLQPVVQIGMGKAAVIFARADSGVASLGQMAGHSFAFGDTNATLSFWAKFYLMDAQINGRDLSRYAILDSQAVYLEQVRQKDFDPAAELSSHSEVVRAVLAGEFDAGVARLRPVQNKLGKELVPLLYFDSDPNLWVARAGLPSKMVEALKTIFLSLSPEELKIFVGSAQGFRDLDLERLHKLRTLEKEVEKSFPDSAPVPSTEAAKPHPATP
jgi:serine/threonine protein kinase